MRLAILAFACGIGFLQTRGELPAAEILAAIGTAGFAGVLLGGKGRHRLSRLALLLGCALLGFAWAGWRAQQRLADELPAAWEARDIRLTGVVAALPQRFERGERFAFDVESVETPEAVVPRHVLLSWYHGWDDVDEAADLPSAIEAMAVHPGERWRFRVRLKRPHGNANPHGFDYEAHLLERNVRATGTVRARGEAHRLDGFVATPGYAVERLRDRIRGRFLAVLPDAPYAGVLIALAIGDQRAIPNAQWLVFNRTGITHLVSISGLHVTMVAALFAGLVNWLWRRSGRLMLRLPAHKAAVAAGGLAALAYALLAGFEVPAQRTFYMLSVVALALWSGRNFGASRTLLLALLAVLLLDPWAVLATGFWLSFGAVAVLFFVGSGRLGAAGGRAGWRAAIARWGVTQWAVTLASLPLLLLFFQQFSLVSPLANAAAIPFVSFVVTPLALVFAVLPWPPLLHFDHWLLAQLMALLEWLAAWPVWQQAAPPWWAALLAVAGAVWLLLPRGFPARWLGLFMLLPALFLPPPRPADGEAWIDVLDVGQGLAVLVRTARHALLYDAGPLYSADANAGQRVVVPYLRATGTGRLDALVVSHRDRDHSGGAAAVRESAPVGRLLSSVAEPGWEPCAAGEEWEWDGVRFAIVHPLAADYTVPGAKPNNLSCVLRVENGKSSGNGSGNGSMLLAADIEAADEKALVGRAPAALRSDVLLVPHHGGPGSSTPEFVAAVGAADAVFSAGYRNSFGHPRPEVLQRHAASRRWRTDRDGAVRVGLARTVELSAWRSERKRYWHGR